MVLRVVILMVVVVVMGSGSGSGSFSCSKGGAAVRALASQQCSPGSNLCVDAICGLNSWFVLPLAERGFSPSTPVFPSP